MLDFLRRMIVVLMFILFVYLIAMVTFKMN